MGRTFMERNVLFKRNVSDKIGIVLFAIAVALLIIALFHINQYIWDDEAFTLNLVSQSYLQVINGTAMDVHPPFHYLFLKFVFDVISFLNISFNQIIVAKLVSVIPIILLLLFNLVVLRKRFGWLFTGLFALCLIGMPKMLLYGFQIRMYSWALFFVTFTFYYSYMVTKESSSIKYWFLLVLFSLLGAYTHYFALITIIVIYLFLFIYFLLKNKKEIKKLLISAILLILLYLPWVSILIDQIQKHHSSHSAPLLINELSNFLWFIFSPSISRTGGNFSIIGLLLILCYIFLIIYFLINSKKFKEKFLYLGPLIVIGTIFLTFLVSKSNFAARYIFISIGVFWFSFSLLLSKSFSKRKIFVPIFIILIISSSMNVFLFLEQQKEHNNVFNEVNAVVSEIKDNDLVVFTNIDVYVSFNKPYLETNNSIYYNIDHNFYEKKLEDRGNYTYSGFSSTELDKLNVSYVKHQLNGLNEIEKALNENRTVWIFTRNTEKEVLNEIIMKLPDSYTLSEKLVLNEKYPDEALPYPKRIFIISNAR
jgi:hypothetical protein